MWRKQWERQATGPYRYRLLFSLHWSHCCSTICGILPILITWEPRIIEGWKDPGSFTNCGGWLRVSQCNGTAQQQILFQIWENGDREVRCWLQGKSVRSRSREQKMCLGLVRTKIASKVYGTPRYFVFIAILLHDLFVKNNRQKIMLYCEAFLRQKCPRLWLD